MGEKSELCPSCFLGFLVELWSGFKVLNGG